MGRFPRSGSVGGGSGSPPTGFENSDPEPDPDSAAHTICLRLLAVRARTRAELDSALKARNVPADAASRVLDRLARVGLVDDVAFASGFAGSRRADRGLSSREISRQLRNKGVDVEVIETVLADADGSEYGTARHWAERKLRSMSRLEPAVQTRRLVAMLARKGYPPSLTFQVVREVVGEVGLDGLDEDAGLG